MFVTRSMRQADLMAVETIQAQAYADHFLESSYVIAQRLASSPTTSWVAEHEGQICAYLVGYWSSVGKISALNARFTVIENADCLYVHDLALLEAVQGIGLARLLINAATEHAISRSAKAIALISVQNSVAFWRKQGFTIITELDAVQQKNFDTYLPETQPVFYMVKTLVYEPS